jgi:hypothetical protein
MPSPSESISGIDNRKTALSKFPTFDRSLRATCHDEMGDSAAPGSIDLSEGFGHLCPRNHGAELVTPIDRIYPSRSL